MFMESGWLTERTGEVIYSTWWSRQILSQSQGCKRLFHIFSDAVNNDTIPSPEPSFRRSTVLSFLSFFVWPADTLPICSASQRWERMSFSCLCHSSARLTVDRCAVISHTVELPPQQTITSSWWPKEGSIMAMSFCAGTHSHSQPSSYRCAWKWGFTEAEMIFLRILWYPIWIFWFSRAFSSLFCFSAW